MASYQDPHCISVEAGQDLSAKQYFFMTVASDGQMDPTGDGLIGHGILQDKPTAAGVSALLAIGGVSKVVAGGTCTAGSYGAADTNGKAVNAVSGDFALCVFLDGTTVANDIVRCIVMPQLGKVWG